MSLSTDSRRVTILKIAKRIRLTEPWHYKAPFLISIVYFFLAASGARFPDSFLAAGCALCTIAGIASTAYLSNDLADRDSDRRAGKPNCALDLAPSRIAVLFAISGAAALLPWMIFVPVDRIWTTLLALEFLLFAAYLVRPIRLKERGWLGLTTDALYAHANPALLAGYVMYRLTGQSYRHPAGLLGALTAWQFFVGLRGILEHQISDAENDRLGGTSTYVTQAGEAAATRLLRRFVVPLELFSFGLYLSAVSWTLPALAIVFLAHVLVTALLIHHYTSRFASGSLHERLVLFLDDFSLGWMPLVILVDLAWNDWRNAVLLVVHFALFQSRLLPLFRYLQRAGRDLCLQVRLRRPADTLRDESHSSGPESIS